jgi:hypothetical protein
LRKVSTRLCHTPRRGAGNSLQPINFAVTEQSSAVATAIRGRRNDGNAQIRMQSDQSDSGACSSYGNTRCVGLSRVSSCRFRVAKRLTGKVEPSRPTINAAIADRVILGKQSPRKHHWKGGAVADGVTGGVKAFHKRAACGREKTFGCSRSI